MDETTQDTGYEEFMTGLEGDGYQTETAAEPLRFSSAIVPLTFRVVSAKKMLSTMTTT